MFGRMTIARKLAFGFGAFVVMLAIAVFLGLSRLDALNDMMDRIVSKDWRKTVLANEAIDLMNANSRETFLLFHVEDRAAVQQRMEANKQAITQKIDMLEGLLYHPEGKALIAEIREKRKIYVGAFSNVAALIDAGETAAASKKMAAEVVPALDTLLASIDKLIRLQGNLLEESGKESAAAYAASRMQMLLGLLLAVFIGTALALWIIRSVVRPLGGEPEDVLQVVNSVAQGDLTATVRVKPGDDHSLLAAMARMQSSLQKMVAEVKENAEGVASAAEQLSTTSSQVAAATAAQSEAASAMAAAVEQMTVSVNHVAERAHDAHAVTAQTGGLSQEGDRVIQQTVTEMQEISRIVGMAAENIQTMGDRSQQISRIVQVIKEVAEQTNLLALNAAIEAARAGEQGRGFAVVADEVRKLAERTAKATTEISDMIGAVQSSAQSAVCTMRDAVGRVEQGVGMAQQASSSMSGISDGAQNVVAAVTEISSALREQSTVSNEIAMNVEKIAQMSEENGAATREAADTAFHLEALAAGARSTVAQFRV